MSLDRICQDISSWMKRTDRGTTSIAIEIQMNEWSMVQSFSDCRSTYVTPPNWLRYTKRKVKTKAASKHAVQVFPM